MVCYSNCVKYDNRVKTLHERKDVRMANLSVASIRERIFNTTKHENNVARPQNSASHNPFAQMNGNLLNADVYVSSTNHAEKLSFSGRIDKLKKAAQVGSLSKMGEKINAWTESAVAFGRRIKEGVSMTWKKLNEWTIEDAVMSMIDRTPSQKYYATAPVKSTEKTLTDLIALETSRMAA